MRERYFQRPNGEQINASVVAIVFGDNKSCYAIDKAGRRNRTSDWRLRDAISLVETGHWVELRTGDEPSTEIEGGAW